MRAIVLSCLVVAAAPLWATGSAYMVRDIKVEPQSELVEFGAFGEFVAFDGFVYFGQNDGIHGMELWRWSPTAEPEQVVDICPGACWSLPWNFVEWSGSLYFTAGGAAREVWSTDGTDGGTRRVTDVAPGNASSFPRWLTPAPDALYFAAGETADDVELWKTDGTTAGTVRVADIRPGPAGSEPASLVYHEGYLYFTADDGVHGREIWRTDGTPAGTSMVDELCPGPGQCVWLEQWLYNRRNAIEFTGRFLLAPLDRAGAYGLASLDLAGGGVEYLEPYPRGILKTFTHLGDAVLFAGFPNELWRSDGTPAGTVLLASFDWEPRILGVLNGLAYFLVRVGSEHQLWSTDGSKAGTGLVVSLGEAAPGIDGVSLAPGTLLGDRLLFRVGILGLGSELWSTDGTAEGTSLVLDANPGPPSAFVDLWYPTMMTLLGDEAVYRSHHSMDGWEPWRSDGTPTGTQLIADLFAPSDGMPAETLESPTLFAAAADDLLLFAADDGATGIELWSSDGSDEGTLLVADLLPGEDENGDPNSSYPRVWFGARGLGFLTSRVGVASASGHPGDYELLGVNEFWGPFVGPLLAPDGQGGLRVFSGGLAETDGTAAGTSILADDVNAMSLAVVGDRLFVSRTDEATGAELWVGEGDPTILLPVADIQPGAEGSDPLPVGSFHGQYLFSADDGATGRELWASDGSLAGTREVRDIRSGPEASSPGSYEPWSSPAVTRWGAFFVADDGVSGRELWISDGTEAGTRRVADIHRGPAPSDPDDLAATTNRVFFFADDGVHGREPWVARGDGSGAHMLADLVTGPRSSAPSRRLGRELAAIRGRVYFGATDGRHGVELWTSDGTEHGTRRVQDINPGPGSSSPVGFVVAGNCLYFAANDGEHGFELWALPIDPATGLTLGGRCGSVREAEANGPPLGTDLPPAPAGTGGSG